MATTKPLPRLLTIPEVMTLLGCCETYVYSLIGDGDLTTVDISRRGSRKSKTRVPEDAAREFLAARTSTPKRLRAAG